MNWAFNDEDPAFRRLPDDERALSQLLLIYDGRDLHELVNREFQTARIVLSVNVHGANAIGEVIDAIRTRLTEQPVAGVAWDIGGFGRLFADQEDLLVIGQVTSFWGAFVQIFLILLVLWRSLTASIITLLPNLAPLYFIFVLMGLAGIPLDMATALIAGVVLGITVDDTIHLYHSYLRRRRAGHGWVFALARSFEASGRAVVAISILLVAQFALLTTSEFQPTADFGLLASVGLLSGQIFELLLLPALIVVWNRWSARSGGQRP
jgi:predicted RND superfamily exporter protein